MPLLSPSESTERQKVHQDFSQTFCMRSRTSSSSESTKRHKVHQEPAPAPPAMAGFRIRRPFPVATAGSHPQATRAHPGTEHLLARAQDSLIGELFAPEALTPTRMSLETMDPLAHRRANRAGTAINPFQSSTFHQCRQCLRIQAHHHSNARALPHRRTPRARQRQVRQVIPAFGLISPRLNLLITDRDSAKKTLAHTNSVDDSLERHRCMSRH